MFIHARRALACAFATIFATTLMASAHAQFAVPIKNIDEPGRSPYKDNAALSTCVSQCTFFFKPIPAGSRLVITHLSVAFHNDYPGGGGVFANFGSQIAGGGDTYDAYLPAPTSLGNTIAYYYPNFVISAPISAYAEPLSTPILVLTGGVTNFAGQASLVGYLVALN